MPTILSDTSRLQKKKKQVTFKNSFLKCPRDNFRIRESQQSQKSNTINLPLPSSHTQKETKAKTCIPFESLTDLYLNRQPNNNNSITKKTTIQTQYNFDPESNKRNDLFIKMFHQKFVSTVESSNSIAAFDESKFSSFGKNFSSKSNIKSILEDESPFKTVERDITKKKQAFKKKSLSGLEKVSKKLLNDLNAQQTFDGKTSIMRQRYLSYFHSRVQKKSLFFYNSSNRQSLQKSHQNTRSKTIDCIMGQKMFSPKMKSCVKSCLKLIDSCKKAQRQQNLRKEVNIFTIYSQEFAKKCEKKFNSIETIKRAL